MASADGNRSLNVEPPDFIVPGIRCALEMVIVGAIVLFVGLPATNGVYEGLIVVIAVVCMVVVLFWGINRQIEAWIVRVRRGNRRS